MQDISVKRFRTLMRGRVHSDNSKSYNNGGSDKLFRRGRRRCVAVPKFHAGNCHFALGREVSRMADYTKAQLADIHLAYRGCRL